MRNAIESQVHDALAAAVVAEGAAPVAARVGVSVATLYRALHGQRVCGVTLRALNHAARHDAQELSRAA